jgi:MoaA/NifB/PqqE/SkfB family radical SAM enzyme
MKAGVHDLDYFFWEATLRCNLTCRHCGSDCTRDAQQPELPAEKVLSVFHDIAAHTDASRVMVAVTGGEPLLRADLFPILTEVTRLGFPWGMVTNGQLVTEKTVEHCLRAGMRTVTVSLDGLEDAHDWLRHRPGAYRHTVRALQLLLAAHAFQPVEVITCVHAGNVDDLPGLYNLLRELGVGGWRIFTIFPKGRALQTGKLVTTGTLLTQVLAFIKEYRRRDPDWPLLYCEEGFLGCEWERVVRDVPHYCGAGITIGGLLCDGAYSACPSLSRQWVQGHVDELPFSQAWETRYQNMRDRHWMRNDFCGACRQWGNCQASSLHLWDWDAHRPRVCHWRLLHDGE